MLKGVAEVERWPAARMGTFVRAQAVMAAAEEAQAQEKLGQ